MTVAFITIFSRFEWLRCSSVSSIPVAVMRFSFLARIFVLRGAFYFTWSTSFARTDLLITCSSFLGRLFSSRELVSLQGLVKGPFGQLIYTLLIDFDYWACFSRLLNFDLALLSRDLFINIFNHFSDTDLMWQILKSFIPRVRTNLTRTFVCLYA